MKVVAMIALAVMCVWPLSASAFQCPKLQSQIDKEFGKRFDRTATSARSVAAQAAVLHKEGKHAESVKMYEEAAKAGGLKLTETK
jgi:hypothetical protein